MRDRVRQAMAATLLVYAVTSLCAASAVIPIANSVPPRALAERPAVLPLFTAVRLFDTVTASPLRLFAVPALTLIVVTPLLQVMWLRAQLTPAPVHEHARAAARVYLQAWVVYAASAGYAALLALAARLLASLGESSLVLTHNRQLQQCAGTLLALPLVLAAFVHAPSVADRAQLELARGRALSLGLLRAVLKMVGLRTCLVRTGFNLAAAAIVVLGLIPRLWLGAAPAAGWLLFACAQLTTLVRTLVRGAWLAWLAEQAAPDHRTRSKGCGQQAKH